MHYTKTLRISFRFSLCHGFYLSLFSSSLLWFFSRLVSWSLVEIQLALLTSILKPVNACFDTKPTNAGKSKGAEWNAVRANKMQDAGQCWTRLYHLISCRPGLCFCRDATWLSCAIGHVVDGCLGSCLTNRGRRCGGLRMEMLSGPRKKIVPQALVFAQHAVLRDHSNSSKARSFDIACLYQL